MIRSVSVVVLDLDNTLYDWVDIWYQSFSAMLTQLVADSGVTQRELEEDFRSVHQRHGTSEYAFAIQELESLKARYGNEQDLARRFDGAIHAYRRARLAALRLYPSVLDTLQRLHDRRCLLVGFTESMAFYTNFRVRNLDLDLYLDFLYSPVDHQLPLGLTPDQIRKYPRQQYEYRHTVQRFTPEGAHKPSPDILLSIIDQCGASREETIYIGDSLMKDIVMAQQAGVTDVLALYGKAQDREEYELLRRVTHWTEAAVEREKRLSIEEVKPTYVLESRFGKILDLFEFRAFRPTAIAAESAVISRNH
jgi:phosphoglycolate phosphatase